MIGFLGKTLNPALIREHVAAVMMIWALYTITPAALGLFMIFLFIGSFTIIDLDLSWNSALLLDAGLCVLFFLQHSILIRSGVRRRFAPFIPDAYYPGFYGLSSGIALFAVMILWQSVQTPVAVAGGIVNWILRGLFFLCLAGFYWGVKSLGSFDALGVKPLMRHITQRHEKLQEIIVKGPYRWVRHPLYLLVIILFWLCPGLTPDRLLFNLLWTLWIVVGTVLEDRDLHREFGNRYLEYSSRVPMLIPYRFPKV